MTIGIPQALFYWKNPYFWEAFFEKLGAKVILSPKTNKDIVAMGVKTADPETCFSMKVFFGHLLWLDGKCDLIFIPRLKAKRMRYLGAGKKEIFEFCPKFFGLPDLAKLSIKTAILTEIFDERKKSFDGSLMLLGRKVNKDRNVIKKAIDFAFLKKRQIKEEQTKNFAKKFEFEKEQKKRIVLISHQYNLYDDYVNVGMKRKLNDLGMTPIFIDEVPVSADYSFNSGIQFHWEFGREIMAKAKILIQKSQSDFENQGISGAIEISSFQCGCDAVLKEFVEKEFKKNKIPFLYLIIDEQTGEAGIQTRLEAFADTI